MGKHKWSFGEESEQKMFVCAAVRWAVAILLVKTKEGINLRHATSVATLVMW